MEYQEVKEYLDNLIQVREEAKSCECLNSSIQAIMISYPEIHMYSGIEIVADTMGIRLDSKKLRDGTMKYFFTYSGTEFFQLGSSDSEHKV